MELLFNDLLAVLQVKESHICLCVFFSFVRTIPPWSELSLPADQPTDQLKKRNQRSWTCTSRRLPRSPTRPGSFLYTICSGSGRASNATYSHFVPRLVTVMTPPPPPPPPLSPPTRPILSCLSPSASSDHVASFPDVLAPCSKRQSMIFLILILFEPNPTRVLNQHY